MQNQSLMSDTAERLARLSTGTCIDVVNHLIGKGYFLKLDHIGMVLQECYMALLCILSLRTGRALDSDDIQSLVTETGDAIRNWLTGVYTATRRDFDYDHMVVELVENMYPYYQRWRQQLTGGDGEISDREIGKWIPAATAACIRKITAVLEQDLDINLSHEIDELNEIVYRHLDEVA